MPKDNTNAAFSRISFPIAHSVRTTTAATATPARSLWCFAFLLLLAEAFSRKG